MSDARAPRPDTGGRSLQPASFIHLGCALDDITINLEPGDPPLPTPIMIERWARATASNPRLFNGPILRFSRFDPTPERAGRHVVTAQMDTYQRYGMQQHDPAIADPESDVYHLAVTGVVTVHDSTGGDSVLLGKRGPETFVYPGMWEHAPGGGLDTTNIYGQLLREMEEELGLVGLVDGIKRDELLEPRGPNDVLGLAIDPNTPSVDVVVRVRMREGAERSLGTNSWEYGSTRFVPTTGLTSFIDQEGEATIIPPTLAIWRGMGWV